MRVMAMVAQADAGAVAALERIATAQIVIAIVMVLIGFMTLALLGFVLVEFRAIKKLLDRVITTADELKPRVIPLIDRAKAVTDDVSGMTDNVRRKVDDVLHTLEDLRRAVEKGGHATEERVRRFGAVLDIVQSEAEEILVDATATARGVHETARALQRPRRALKRPHRSHDEEEE
jgi:methyl-accepting chemotaxis protein